MKIFLNAAALCSVFCTLIPTSAFALDVAMDDALCPIDVIGEAELDRWASSLADAKGQMTDAQEATLIESVKACAEKLSWSENDTVSALEFNLSIISGAAIGDKLLAAGIDAVGYETVLENRTSEDLRQILEDPDNSPALKELSERIIADFGDDLTDEITVDIATYIAFMAQSQLSVMKMMGAAD